MNRVGEFEKVSYEQFYEAMSELIDTEYKDEFIKASYDALEIPQRATGGSAGYDFKAPFSFELHPGETLKIPTGIRVKIDEVGGLVVCLVAGSGLSIVFSSTILWALLIVITMVQIMKVIFLQR